MRSITDLIGGRRGNRADPPGMELTGRRSESLYRLQVCLVLIVAIVLMVALANVIMERANRAEANSVPDAAATVAPSPSQVQQNDPLADAGVVPELPASPTPTPTAAPPAVTGQVDGLDTQ